MTWTGWAPGVAQFRGYKRAWLRGDLLAGLTVAAYLIPQVMAYATVAGLSPVAGLWAALAPLLIYALLGSSRHMSVGPESTTALMVVAVLAPFAAGDASRYAALAAVLGVLVGAICFLAGIARLGFLANLLSRPVLVGYMTGIALVMMASQLGKLTGASVVGDEFVDQMRSFARGVGDLHWPTMLLAGAVLALLLALDRWAPRVPGPLIAVVAAAAAVALSLESKGIVVVGSVPSGLPTPAVPLVSPNELAALVIPAAGIAIVAFSDNILTARIFATRHGYEIDANAELRAIGVCNIAAGLTRGFPVSSSGSRTAIGDAVGQPHADLLAGGVVVGACGHAVRERSVGAVPVGGAGGAGRLCRAAAYRCLRIPSTRTIPPQRTDHCADDHRGRLGYRSSLRCACRSGALGSGSTSTSSAWPRQRARLRARGGGHA